MSKANRPEWSNTDLTEAFEKLEASSSVETVEGLNTNEAKDYQANQCVDRYVIISQFYLGNLKCNT